jgi:hypothetical protein
MMNKQIDELYTFTVRFIIPRSAGLDRGMKALYTWRDHLVKAAVGNQNLDVSGVYSCMVVGVTMGDVAYGGEEDLLAVDLRTEVRARSVVSDIAP